MRILISAGEASGELYGAQLVAALQRLQPGAECFGVGGERMRAAGCEIIVQARDVAVVGLAEVVAHLPRIWRRFRQVLRATDARKPDVAVLIDFPDFNLRLAKQLHRRGIPVVYYVSPQLWAWREGRVEQIRRTVRKLLVIFPFEVEFYRRHDIAAEFVGHPLADEPAPRLSRNDFAREETLDAAKPWIALLPGSRRNEALLNLPAMMAAAGELQRRQPGCQFVLPLAPIFRLGDLETPVERLQKQCNVADVTFTHDARAALAHARAAVVASGTATVEAALLGTAMVVVYRVAPLSWTMGRRLVRVPHFAMVNLLASGWKGEPAPYAGNAERLVPELIQHDFTAENVVRELQRIAGDGPERERMLAGLAQVREKLRAAPDEQTAAQRAGQAVIEVAKNAG